MLGDIIRPIREVLIDLLDSGQKMKLHDRQLDFINKHRCIPKNWKKLGDWIFVLAASVSKFISENLLL